MHVLIVGGSVGGLSLAQCLRKLGVSFEIFERDESPDSRFQGWAIGIHTIVDELQAAFPDDLPNLKDATDHLQPHELPAQMAVYLPGRDGRIGVESTPEAPIVRAERYRLRQWLSTNLPIQWGKRVQRIEHDDQGAAVFFEDGTSAKGDILVGADGINSMASELLNVVPLAAVVGEVTLKGEQFKRQLELGHSAYVYMNPAQGFAHFNGLHYALPDGVSGRHYWMFMQPDPNVAAPDHWLRSASQQEKLDHVLKLSASMPAALRELFELTPVSGIKTEPHIWRDLELESLPAGRVVLLGDSAHAMTPFRGEGAYHAFIDSLKLSKLLSKTDGKDMGAVKAAVAEYNAEMLDRGVRAVQVSRNADSGKPKDPNAKLTTANQTLRPLPQLPIVLPQLG
ncbi:monooxygenase [Apiospora saccharicola]|uniref:Monooxygenase n=1 Tax=Apiospora saccharicola TaxID=335842 RepID=A0ABR1UJH6_9PEZI